MLVAPVSQFAENKAVSPALNAVSVIFSLKVTSILVVSSSS